MNLKGVAEFLALRRNTSLLLVALLLAGTGERLWLGFAPKYIETLGGSILITGLFDALQTLLGALYAHPGGGSRIVGDGANHCCCLAPSPSLVTCW